MTDNDTIALFPLLLSHAENYPDRAAIITPDQEIRYGEIPRRVQAIADGLIAEGFNPDAMTGVTLPDDTTHLLVSITLLCLGTPNINLASFEVPERHARTVDQLAVSQLIATPGLQAELIASRKIAGFHPPTNQRLSGLARDRLINQSLKPEDRVLYLSTSGTTDAPKTFGRTMAHTMHLSSLVARNPLKDCVLRTSSVEHDSSRVNHVCTLLAGKTAAILHPVTADTLAPFCARAGVTEVHGGTYRLASLLAAPPDPAHKLPEGVRFLTGASRVPGSLRTAAIERLTPELYVSFATSEIGTISIAQPDEHAAWPEGVGYPKPGIEIELRDINGEPVPRGDVGQIWVRKYGVPGDGTVSNPGWVTSGDLLSWPENGPLVFHARNDDMMIMNGINIYPGAIEDTLNTHPAVAEVVAYPQESRVHGQIPVAAVVLGPGATANGPELVRHAREQLGLRGPRQVRVVDRIPRNASGKPLIRELREQAPDAH